MACQHSSAVNFESELNGARRLATELLGLPQERTNCDEE